VALEANARRGNLVEQGAGFVTISVAAEMLGAQRIDHDKEHVDVFALAEPFDVLDGSSGAPIPFIRIPDLDE